jgi:glycosyltransferase involved in cell wall biosynthesis
MKLSIIVPCYNESKNIPLIFEKFKKVIKREDVEVLFVNNGSTDDSQETLEKLLPNYKFARIINIYKNEGYGHGITCGLSNSKSEFIGYTHADMQTDPADTMKAFEIIENQSNPKLCYVKGVRKKRPFFDQFFSLGMSLFETIYLNTKLWDINAQPNIFHKNFFRSIKNSCPKDFSLDLYFLYMAKKKKLNIIRFDVIFSKRIHGKSSWNNSLGEKWKFIKRTLKFSVKLKKKNFHGIYSS